MHSTEDLQNEAYRAGLSSILFACMSIEAFINHYGVKRLGETFYKRFIERFGITEKIAVLVLICSQKIIEQHSPIITKARNLFDTRNRLVHPKAREIHVSTINDFIVEHPKELQLKELLDDMECIIDEFCALDPSIPRDFEFRKT